MQPTSWKVDSPKSRCRILHNPGLVGPQNASQPRPVFNLKRQILWYRIRMRLGG